MATKKTSSCLQKAADEEPIFVLRAQDLSAPVLVEFWVKMNPQISEAKRDDALKVAHDMREWQQHVTVKKAD
jgi:hypothetical protein